LVAVATGKIDGIMAIVGFFIGAFLYNIGFTMLDKYVVSDIYKYIYSGNLGFITLPELAKVRPGIVILAIALFAIGFFWFGELIEKRAEDKK